MPRRKRGGKRRAEEFAHLDGSDMLDLLAGWTPPEGDERTQLQTIDDCGMAWAAHRDADFFAPDQCGRRPWAWWEFEAPEPRDPRVSHLGQLAKLGLLTVEHVRRIRQRFDFAYGLSRQWGEAHPFNAVNEGEALEILDLLTEEERRVVRDTKREYEKDAKRWEKEDAMTDDTNGAGDEQAVERLIADEIDTPPARPQLERALRAQEERERRFVESERASVLRGLGIKTGPFNPHGELT